MQCQPIINFKKRKYDIYVTYSIISAHYSFYKDTGESLIKSSEMP